MIKIYYVIDMLCSIDILCSTMRACHLKSNTDIDCNKKVPATNQLTIGRQCLFLVHYQLVECKKTLWGVFFPA